MTGRLSLSRMILVFLLPRTCAAVPRLFHTMGSHRAGSGVCLGVHLGHVGPKTLSTVTALTPLELAAVCSDLVQWCLSCSFTPRAVKRRRQNLHLASSGDGAFIFR